jgi:predicted regulator of Ras-like GTPase activity (Roadblock/LC7/MglB family)
VSGSADALTNRLAALRTSPGIRAALLISRDGFVVASDADETIDSEAVAAQVAGVIDIGQRLADELGQTEARYFSVELESLNVVLAPFGSELLLALIGDPDALNLSYTLIHPGGN